MRDVPIIHLLEDVSSWDVSERSGAGTLISTLDASVAQKADSAKGSGSASAARR
jgi:hypothetical protein